MQTLISIVVIIIVITSIIKYNKYEQTTERTNHLKSFKINSIMRRLKLLQNQKAVLNDGLLLTNNKNQLIQIAEINYNYSVLLINRANKNKKVTAKLKNLNLENLDNIREWVLHDLYTIQ